MSFSALNLLRTRLGKPRANYSSTCHRDAQHFSLRCLLLHAGFSFPKSCRSSHIRLKLGPKLLQGPEVSVELLRQLKPVLAFVVIDLGLLRFQFLPQPVTRFAFVLRDRISDEPPATIWSYRTNGCVLDVFFYMDLGARTFRVLAYEMKANRRDAQTDRNCVGRIRAASVAG